MSEERCVCCGETIPEGIQVFQFCEDTNLYFARNRLYESIHNGTAEDINYWRGYIDGTKIKIKNSFNKKENKGEWKISWDGYYPYCSICGNEPQGIKMTDYCPNCGADMRGDIK